MRISVSTSSNAAPPKENFFSGPIGRGVILILLAAFTLWVCLRFSNVNGVDEAGVVMDLPSSVGPFWGIDQPISESEKVILPKDTEFAKKLYRSGDDQINCQIVLTGAQKQKKIRPSPIKSTTSMPLKAP